MKILRISLKNLASLEGLHSVDFTREPLRSAGLYGISGPTGAGKSTLLDALCLALYEDTPRLRAASGAKIPEADNREITQKDPGNLLRRGCGDGFAEVAFIGVDGQAYTARWELRRAHGKPDGALQKAEMTLFRGNLEPGGEGTIEQGGKKSEVKDKIEQKIGLNFEQFTRAVLLAQNEFASFLKAEDKDRAVILQTLTGTERFELLSKAIFERQKREQDAIQRLEAMFEGNKPLSAEERALAEKALAENEAVLAGINAEKDACERLLERHGQARELLAKFELTEKTSRQAGSASREAEPRRRRLEGQEIAAKQARPLHDAALREREALTESEKSLKQAGERHTRADAARTKQFQAFDEASRQRDAARQAVEAAQPDLAKARQLDADLQSLDTAFATAEREALATKQALEKTGGELATVGAELTLVREKQERAQTALDELTPYRPLASEAGTWAERLETALASAKRHAEARQQDTARNTEVLEARKASEASAQNLQQAQAKTTEDTRLAETARQTLQAFDETQLAARERQRERRSQDFAAADALLVSLRKAEAQASHSQTSIETLNASLEKSGKELARYGDEAQRELETRTRATSEAHELMRASFSEQALALRLVLKPGQPCPVCGAREHPTSEIPHDIQRHLAPLQKRLAELEKEKTDFIAERSRLETDLRNKTEQRARENAALASLREQLEQIRAKLQSLELGRALLALVDAATQDRHLDTERAALAAEEKTLASQRERLAAARKANDEALKNAARSQTALDQAKDKNAKERERLSRSEEALRAAQKELAASEAEKTQAEARLEPLFAALPSAREGYAKAPQDFLNAFRAKTESCQKLEKDILAHRHELELKKTRETSLKTEHERGQSLDAQRQAAREEARRNRDARRAERQALLGGKSTADFETGLSEALKTAETRLQASGEGKTKAEGEFQASVENAKQTQTRFDASKTAEAVATKALAAWLAEAKDEHGAALTHDRLLAWLKLGDAELQTERQFLAALEKTRIEAENECRLRKDDLEKHQAQLKEIDTEEVLKTRQQELAKKSKEAEQQKIAAAGKLSGDDRVRSQQAELSAQIEAARQKALPWFRLNELLGSSDGAKFRGIAQRRTLDLLLGYANAQLQLLNARYRLERLPRSLNLIVLDRDMGDERRSVHTLSGGESFLVSLALALGLASLSSNRVRIETLFIDEGFGSLDQETLGVAMNALMQLEAQGRKVGVISHVTEMADAIPVQIRVARKRSGSSKIVLPYPSDPASQAEPLELGLPVPAAVLPADRLEALQTQALAYLATKSGKATKAALRDELALSDAEYEQVKAALLATGKVKPTKGRGSALTLN